MLGPRTDYEVGQGPRSIASGDLNRDGHPDLVVGGGTTHCCDLPPPEVSAILNLGDGTFGPEAKHFTGWAPHFVTVSDLTLDGEPDLVVLRWGVNGVTVVPGIGGGAFGVPAEYGTAVGPIHAAVGDLDGDGVPDLAVANSGADNISILLNQTEPPARRVPVDIRPFLCRKPLHPSSRGFLNVALLGTAEFDVRDLDPGSVTLEGVAPVHVPHWTLDIGSPGEESCGCRLQSRDGRRDRFAVFRVQDVLAVIGPGDGESERTLTLRASLLDGTRIEGSDCLRIGDRRLRLSPDEEPSLEELVKPDAPVRLWEMVPNPMPSSGTGTLAYRVPDAGAEVAISVHSVSGRRVKELADGFQAGGMHTVTWSGRGDGGAQLAPGVYFVKTRIGAQEYESRIVLLR